MTSRVSLPANLTGATLTRSGEGVTFARQSASVPASSVASRTVSTGPTLVQQTYSPQSLTPGVTVTETTTVSAPPSTTTVKDWGFSFSPMNVIWLVLIFVVVWVILYTTRTNMVTDLVNGERVINTCKLIFWTVLITVIIAVLGFVLLSTWNRSKTVVV